MKVPSKIGVDSSITWVEKTNVAKKSDHAAFPVSRYTIQENSVEINIKENAIRFKVKEESTGTMEGNSGSQFVLIFKDESKCFCKSDIWEDPKIAYGGKYFQGKNEILIIIEDEDETIYFRLDTESE